MDMSEIMDELEVLSVTFTSDDEVEEFLCNIKDLKLGLVELDADSKHFETVRILLSTPITSNTYTDTPEYIPYCIVQGESKDIRRFTYYKTVDGGFAYKDKNQLELAL